MSNFGIGFIAGMIVMTTISLFVSHPGDRSSCRAANPGYDCVVGWVKGEAFK